jgi:isoquinoline 1-oxidoreductase alpha subunit
MVLGTATSARHAMPTVININGKDTPLDVVPEMPLLWALRENAGLTGTKFGCGIAACGACTVHINGAAVRSCVMPCGSMAGLKVTTIEGLGGPEGEHPVQRAWRTVQVPQCGYCQSGMIMAAAALLAATPHPTDDQIDAAMTNICRCGTYPRVREAIHLAAKEAA